MLPGIILALLLAAATSLQSPEGAERAHSPGEDLRHLDGPGNLEPPTATIMAGDDAPDFTFESRDRGWLRLHDLLGQGHVLLVFGADNVQLAAIDRERDELLARGIVPVAVLDRRDGAVWSTARRLGLRYSLLADPQCVISAQFNVLHPTTRRPMSSWFVIDRSGRVRGLRRGGLPGSGYASLAAAALGMPVSSVNVSTGTR